MNQGDVLFTLQYWVLARDGLQSVAGYLGLALCWYWQDFYFGGGTGHWGIILFPNFLRSLVLRRARQLVYTMFISNNRPSFHLW